MTTRRVLLIALAVLTDPTPAATARSARSATAADGQTTAETSADTGPGFSVLAGPLAPACVVSHAVVSRP